VTTKAIKVLAWAAAAEAVEDRARLMLALVDRDLTVEDIARLVMDLANRDTNAEDTANHMLDHVAPSLRRRAEIIARRKTRKP
jgi:hypothetical protein